eukprot:GHVU01092305.1.p2 GENE.GHVU01092305.1~~GHVU01092305.1.p2  ORF type:complete len:137 (-),score=17.25 GHVU01092305.1:2948-3358(-)
MLVEENSRWRLREDLDLPDTAQAIMEEIRLASATEKRIATAVALHVPRSADLDSSKIYRFSTYTGARGRNLELELLDFLKKELNDFKKDEYTLLAKAFTDTTSPLWRPLEEVESTVLNVFAIKNGELHYRGAHLSR